MFQLKVNSDITLIAMHDGIVQALYQLVVENKKYLNQWLVWPALTNTIDDTKLFVTSTITGFTSGKSLNCVILYRDKVVGTIGFIEIVQPLKKAEIGYWLASEYQGNGIVTTSCKTLMKYAFSELDVNYIQFSVASKNWASQKVCKRLELNFEGTIRNAENIHGRIVDHVIYGCYKE